MAIRITKKDLFWSYLGFFFNICVNIILLPFVIKFLPTKELGLWYVFTSISSFVTILDFGFLPTMTRNITYCLSGAKGLRKEGLDEYNESSEPNFGLMNVVIKTCKVIYLVISLIAFVLLISVGTLYIKHVTKEMNQSKYIIAWLIYSVAIFLNLYYSYWEPFLRGVGAIKEGQKALVISRCLQIIISLIGLNLGYGILAVVIAYLVSGITLRQVSKKYFYSYDNIGQKLKENQQKINNSSQVREMFSIVWHNAWKLGLVSLGSFMITQSNTMICSTFLGLSITASYGLTIQLWSILTNFGNVFFNTYQSAIAEARLRKDNKKIKTLLSISVASGWISYFCGAVVIIFAGQKVIHIIGSKTNLLPINMIAFMGLYLFLEFNHSMFATFITTGNEVPFAKPSIISGFAIVVVSLIFVNILHLGIWGLMLAQSIVQISYNNWKWPYVVMKQFRISIFKMFHITIKTFYSRLVKFD